MSANRALASGRALKALTLALSVLLALIAAEIGLRLASAGANPRPEAETLFRLARRPPPAAPDCRGYSPQASLGDLLQPSVVDGLVYQLRPGIDTCFRDTRVTTNPQAVRADGPFALPKPDATFRLVLLGDSHAFGWGVEADETFASLLQGELRATAEGATVEVVNAGVPGYNAFQQAALLAGRGLALEPDCVLVAFVGNDLGLPHFLLRPERPAGPSRLWALLRRATGSKRWFTWADESLAAFVVEADLARVPAEYRQMVGLGGYRRALRRMARAAAAAGVPVINVADYSTVPVDAAELAELQRRRGIVHAPIEWPGEARWRLSDDDPHLNAAGHREYARRLLAALRQSGGCPLPGLRPAGR